MWFNNSDPRYALLSTEEPMSTQKMYIQTIIYISKKKNINPNPSTMN